MRKHIEGQRPFLFAAPCGHLSLVTRSVWPPEKFGKSVKTTEEEECIRILNHQRVSCFSKIIAALNLISVYIKVIQSPDLGHQTSTYKQSVSLKPKRKPNIRITLPKAQRTRGLSSSFQSNFLKSYQVLLHESCPNIIFRILLDQE